jgi:hypothetical protein
MLHSLRFPLLAAGLALVVGVSLTTSASAAGPPDRGFNAVSNADGATVQLLQFPDFFGDIVPQLGVFYFDATSQRSYSGTRVLGDDEFLQDARSAWVAPGVDVELVFFDPCTGELSTLNVVVGPDGLSWEGEGPMMPSTLTIASPTLRVFQKILGRDAVAAGTLEGDIAVDLGNSISSTVGRILQRVVQ